MKNATKKKAAKKTTAKTSHAPSENGQQQPQSKLQAAKQAGLFLHTDDEWSMAYFNPKDLHSAERELFG